MTPTTLRRLGLLGALYFAQGLPFGFFVQALPVLLRQRNYSLDEIGLTSLLALPWALKFVWAPVVDRRWLPRFGRRRTWILAMQLAAAITLGVLAIAPGTDTVVALMTAMMIATGVAAALSGFSAQAFGYATHFVLATALCVLAVVVVRALFPKEPA